jgi:EPS-associated MarR family transcriptional regulator
MTKAQQVKTDMRYRVLALIEANPAITQRALAATLGVSLGRVNYGLRALVEKGLIKVNNFKQSETKLTYAYLLTPSGVMEKSALTKAFLARKMEEFDALKAEIEALQGQLGDVRRAEILHRNED